MTERAKFDEVHTRASKIGGVADLEDVRLISAAVKLIDASAEQLFQIQVGIAPSVAQVEDRAIFECRYKVDIQRSDGEPAATIECQYLATYLLGSDATQDLDDLVAFGDVTVLRALHPYLRELVSTVTSRMGLNGITLGVFRVPIPAQPRRKRSTKTSR